MTPRLLIRQAALGALAAAAGDIADPDFAPLIGAQVFLGQTWPSQSPMPGAAPLPNQLLIYGWDEKSETVSRNTTAPQFASTMTLVVETRTETRAPAAVANLPGQPSEAQLLASIDGAVDALSYAVKKAVCQGLGLACLALNNGAPVVEEIRRVDSTNKYAEAGQRQAGNGAVAFDLIYGETFEPLITVDLDEVVVLINPQAGSLATPGNAGNGMIASVSAGLGAVPGTYPVRFTSPTGFTVTRPDESIIGAGTVGLSFSGGGLNFTVDAGSVAFQTGDGFSVFVEIQIENVISFS